MSFIYVWYLSRSEHTVSIGNLNVFPGQQAEIDYTTSQQLVIRYIIYLGMTMWIDNWKSNNWRVNTGGPVKNEEELKQLDALRSKVDITWVSESQIICNVFYSLPTRFQTRLCAENW